MALLGDWNWYLAHWLAWLPILGRGADTAKTEAEAASPPRPRPATYSAPTGRPGLPQPEPTGRQ